ncbi:MAG: hypothetical protein HeimC2_19920 [Candidatus Heimdallarchaeota archaeon LC_2]|nr:MAG: hypothetical protein HeimC2_19920 [Candidatus Heimdallarchaeota archaeon LC_2]
MDEPSNFSFIDDFIAGSAIPQSKSNLEFYLQNDINNIVTLTSEKPLAFHYIEKLDFNLLHLSITNPPISKEMIASFVDFLSKAKKKNEKVVIHCQFGQERTGIMLVVYLIKIKGYNVKNAISEVRTNRPGSLQMKSTLEFLLTNYN